MKDSRTSRDPHSSASVRKRAGTLWNASGSGSGAGGGDTPGGAIFLEGGPVRGCHETSEMSLPY